MRSTSSCTCRICNVAKSKLQDALKMKMRRGRKGSFSTSLTDKPKSFRIALIRYILVAATLQLVGILGEQKFIMLKILSKVPQPLNRVQASFYPWTFTNVAKPQPRRELFSTNNLFGIQQDLQLSTHETLTLATENGLKGNLFENNHCHCLSETSLQKRRSNNEKRRKL